MFLVHKKVTSEELKEAIEDLDRMLTAQFPDDREARALAMSYVIYRGVEAMREEYSAAYARFVGEER